MTITIDPGTREITVEQSDLTPVGGTLYAHDTDAFRHAIAALMDDEMYMWMPAPIARNPPVTVAGQTLAQVLQMVNGFSLRYDDAPGAYSVRLEGSNNNFFDIQNGILAQNSVQVIPTNSAGLIVTQSGANVDTDVVVQVVEDWGVLNFAK